MTFLEKLDFMMKKLGINKNKLSAMSSVPYTTIDTFYKKGYENTKLSTVKKIAEALDVSMDYLLVDTITDEEYGKHIDFSISTSEKDHIKKYRTLDGHGKKVVDFVLDEEAERVANERRQERQEENNVLPLRCSTQAASAGTGCYLGPEEWDPIYVQENDLTRRASFCVPVSGNSMEPRYHDGDILVIDDNAEVELGQVGLYTIDGEGFVKIYGGDHLISLNPEYPNVPMTEDSRCNGKVIGVLEADWIMEG